MVRTTEYEINQIYNHYIDRECDWISFHLFIYFRPNNKIGCDLADTLEGDGKEPLFKGILTSKTVWKPEIVYHECSDEYTVVFSDELMGELEEFSPEFVSLNKAITYFWNRKEVIECKS